MPPTATTLRDACGCCCGTCRPQSTLARSTCNETLARLSALTWRPAASATNGRIARPRPGTRRWCGCWHKPPAAASAARKDRLWPPPPSSRGRPAAPGVVGPVKPHLGAIKTHVHAVTEGRQLGHALVPVAPAGIKSHWVGPLSTTLLRASQSVWAGPTHNTRHRSREGSSHFYELSFSDPGASISYQLARGVVVPGRIRKFWGKTQKSVCDIVACEPN